MYVNEDIDNDAIIEMAKEILPRVLETGEKARRDVLCRLFAQLNNAIVNIEQQPRKYYPVQFLREDGGFDYKFHEDLFK